MSFGHDAYAENPFAVAGGQINVSLSRSTYDALGRGTAPAPTLAWGTPVKNNAAGATLSPTIPAGARINDQVYALFLGYAGIGVTVPTGWSYVRDELDFPVASSTSLAHEAVAWAWMKRDSPIVSPSERGTTVALTTDSGIGIAVIFTVNGDIDVLSSVRQESFAELATTTVGAVTPHLPDTLRLEIAFLMAPTSGGQLTGTPPSTWTEELDTSTTSGSVFNPQIYVASKQLSGQSGVAQSTATSTPSSAASYVSYSVTITPQPHVVDVATILQTRPTSDTIGVSDAVSAHVTLPRATADSAVVSDAVARLVAFARSTSDQLGVGAPANPVVIMGTPTNTAAALTHPISVVIPSGARVNDRAYLVVAVNTGTAAPTITGWTKIFDSGAQLSNTATLVIYSRDALIQLGDAGSALSFEWGTARSQDAVIFTTDGDFDVISAATVQSSLTSTVPVPAITPADANALWLQIALVQPTSGTTVTGTQPSGFTEILDDTPTQGAALNDSLYISKKQLSGQAGTLQAATTSTPSANAKAVVVSMTIAPSYHVKDTASRSVADSRSVSDSVPVSEAVARALVLPRATSDNATVTEAPTTAPQSFTRTASDTVGTSCAATRAVADSRSGSDTIGVSEVVARAFALSRATADSVPVSEVVTRTLVFARATADTIGTSCVGALTGTESRATSDNATISEAVTRALAYSRAASETATVSEVVARSMLLPRAPSDSVVLTDAVARTLVLHRSTSDSAVVSDVATGSVSTAAGAQSRSSTDTIGVSDAVSAHVTLARSTADSAVVSEAATRAAQTFLRTAVDSAAVVDVAAPAVVLHASATDTITFSDAGVAHVHRFRTATDTLGPSDDVARSIALVGRATDSAAVTDVASPRVFLHVSAADALALSEAAAVSLLLLRTAVDTLGIDDAADGIFIPHPIDVEAFDPQVLVVGLTCGLTLVTPLPAIELLTGSAAMELVGVSTDATLASPSTEVDVVAEDLTL